MMNASGVLRAVALFCFLGFGFYGPAVNAGQSSTDAEPITRSATFTEPSTLKDTLDLLGRIGASKMKVQVLQKVEDRIKAYLETDEILGETVEKIIEDIVKDVSDLRERLFKEPGQYGKYSELPESDVDFAADALVKYLPILHSEMWSLSFQIGLHQEFMGGDGYTYQPVGSSPYSSQVHKWLTDQLDKKDVPYIPKGFKEHDIMSARASDIDAKIGISYYSGGPLNYAQYGLFLLSPTWHHSNLASAVLFLQEFCSDVTEKKFDKHTSYAYTLTLKTACEAVSKNLKSLTDVIDPLFWGSTTMYKGHLRPEAFLSYVDWLGKNLSGVGESLEQMLTESSEWTNDSVSKADSAGPFKYGFVFKDKYWEGSTIKEKLPSAIKLLTQSGCLNIFRMLMATKPSKDSASTVDASGSKASDEI